MTIKWNDENVEVEGNYHEGEKAVMYDKNGDGYPGSSAEFEITKITYEGIDVLPLFNDEMLEEMEEKCINYCKDYEPDHEDI
jgi:hypothetical protein